MVIVINGLLSCREELQRDGKTERRKNEKKRLTTSARTHRTKIGNNGSTIQPTNLKGTCYKSHLKV
jgi:hypothetical protein